MRCDRTRRHWPACPEFPQPLHAESTRSSHSECAGIMIMRSLIVFFGGKLFPVLPVIFIDLGRRNDGLFFDVLASHRLNDHAFCLHLFELADGEVLRFQRCLIKVFRSPRSFPG